VIHRAVEAIDYAHGKDQVEIFGRPIFLRRGFDILARTASARSRRREFPPGLRQGSGDLRHELVRDRRSIRSVSIALQTPGPALRVEDDLFRHGEIGLNVDENGADAVRVLDHRDA